MRLNIPFIKQELDYTCGPTAMQMVLKYFGKSVPDKTLCAIAGTNERYGTTRKNIGTAFKTLGFFVHSHHSSSLDELMFYLEHKVPVIVNYRDFHEHNEGHYGVVTGFENGSIYIHDPYEDAAFFKADKEEFGKRWYGLHSKQFTRWMMAVSDQPLPPYPGHVA